MRGVRLIAWPYHAGLRDVGMGLGGSMLAGDTGLRDALVSAGCAVDVETVEPVDESAPEVARIFELDRRLARRVALAREDGALPVVLGGNCCSCLGTVAGAGPRDLGVVWFDAHADFDTPDDNLSGFTDVMGLAILTGSGWRALRETITGFAPVPEADVVLAGVRDLEPYQRERLARSAVTTVPGAIDPGALTDALDALRGRVARVYLHVDLDALDAGAGRANPYAAPGGPAPDALLAGIDAVLERFELAALALTSYDPRVDTDGAVARVARRIAAAVGRRWAAAAAR
ncbi:MAG TPA: arginase family protein [Solirubrobacteraceae bacterium]|nr:arginase family protein [Solirubrobacteraceae bacterium]